MEVLYKTKTHWYHPCPGPVIEEARKLLDDASNVQAVEELCDRISDDFLGMHTMMALAYTFSCQDIWDEEASAEYAPGASSGTSR